MSHRSRSRQLSVPYDESQISTNEIMLFNRRWPISGLVQRKSVTPFPAKTTMGDYSRADRVIESEWVISDFSGGLGIKFARSGRDEDRYWFGNAEARYRWLTLPPEVVTTPGLTGPVDFFQDFNGSLYAVKGLAVYKWDTSLTPDAWAQVDVDPGTGGTQSMTGTEVRSVCVHDGSLYILTDSRLYRYNGSAWSNQSVTGYALASFDDKLWRLDSTNVMQWAITSSITSWTSAGSLMMPPAYCKQLIVYFDQTGLPALHAITRHGVYGYDFDAQRFWPTPLAHPYTEAAGRGATVWQGALYVPVGSSIYKYTGNVVQAMGPDKDEGLPVSYQGDVTQVVAGYGFLYCVINALDSVGFTLPWGAGFDTYSDDTDQQYGAWNLPLVPVEGTTANGALLVSPGQAWHVQSQHVSAMGAAIVAGLSNSHRLWFSDSSGVYYIGVPTGLHNPLQNPATRYASTAFLDTCWQDMGWAEIDKVALSLTIESNSVSATETIAVYAGYDHDESWEYVGTVTAEDHSLFFPGGVEGKTFHAIRLRLVLSRGSDATKTPVLESASLGYMRVPRQLDGWNLTIDLTQQRCREMYEDSQEMTEALFELRRYKKAGLFTYRDAHIEPKTRRVWLHEVIGSEMVGSEADGRYSVLLLELDT